MLHGSAVKTTLFRRLKIFFTDLLTIKAYIHFHNLNNCFNIIHPTTGLFSRKRWATGLAQESNNYGILPCMWYIFLGFNINTTAFCLGPYNLHLLLLKSSMTQQIRIAGWRIFAWEFFLNTFVIPCAYLSCQMSNVVRMLLIPADEVHDCLQRHLSGLLRMEAGPRVNGAEIWTKLIEASLAKRLYWEFAISARFLSEGLTPVD